MPNLQVPSAAVCATRVSESLETVRCFLHFVEAGLPPAARAELERELHDWEFRTPTLQAIVGPQRPHVLRDLAEAMENAKQTLATYPESMHLVVGTDLLDADRLREPLHSERQQLGRGRLGVIHWGALSVPHPIELDAVVASSNLKSEVRRVIRKLHYQRSPPARELPCPPQCQRISTQQDFEASLRLRYNIYHVMGYIPERFRSTASAHSWVVWASWRDCCLYGIPLLEFVCVSLLVV